MKMDSFTWNVSKLDVLQRNCPFLGFLQIIFVSQNLNFKTSEKKYKPIFSGAAR